MAIKVISGIILRNGLWTYTCGESVTE